MSTTSGLLQMPAVQAALNRASAVQPGDENYAGICDDLADATQMNIDRLDTGDDDDDDDDLDDTAEDANDENGHTLLLETAQQRSKGIKPGTEKTYLRLFKQFLAFGIAHKCFGKSFEAKPGVAIPADMPSICVAWIMDKCDYVQLDGTPRPNSSSPATWATAQKMRASLTFVFGKICGLGTAPWHESELTPGVWLGNPSASPVLSSFMTGLSREKNMRGEVATSSRAITADDLQRLHLLNTDPTLKSMPASDPRTKLGGWMIRLMLMALYTICFFCLLRGDEALSLQMQNIELQKGADNVWTLWIWLTHRKTNQHGGVKPFVIRMLPSYLRHLCPVRALMEWLDASGITDGYIFRAFDKAGRPILIENKHISAADFTQLFRCNMYELGHGPWAYASHSFRRGGCQWLHQDLRWHLRKICEWGGWSVEYNNLTIVKYLINHNDNPTVKREDFFNFDKLPTTACNTCGRSCACGY